MWTVENCFVPDSQRLLAIAIHHARDPGRVTQYNMTRKRQKTAGRHSVLHVTSRSTSSRSERCFQNNHWSAMLGTEHLPPRRSITELHWLPVVERITFKLAMLTYCCLHGTAFPRYLSFQLTCVVDISFRRRLGAFIQQPPTLCLSARHQSSLLVIGRI